jgi:hypothetical protein
MRPLNTSGLAVILSIAISVAACGSDAPPVPDPSAAASSDASARERAFVDSLQERTFRYFWDLSDAHTGLTPDRAPTRSFASVAATGFALTAYPIGAERGWVSRDAAGRRVLDTMHFLWSAPQDTSRGEGIGFRGLFYHFLHADTGRRFEDVELSTVDTALLLAGALFCQSYFDGASAEEDSIRALADSLYTRADWQWASPRPPLIGHGWTPEEGFLPYDWGGYNEAAILYLLALGSPTHPVAPDAWTAWTSRYQWGGPHGEEHVGFSPLFGHQYTHVWIDFRGIRDEVMRERDLDYFENSRRAVLAQHAYAVANPDGWTGYGPRLWGLTACDGPVEGAFEIGGRTRQFHTYWARGASFRAVNDDGTICPSAAAASIVFAPDLVLPTLASMRAAYGDHAYSTYGFFDALNPTFDLAVPVQHGRVVRGVGWFDTDYLGIDQGPIVAMIENWRTSLVWRTMRENPHVVRGLRRAGFTGGWLDSIPVAP